VKNIRKFVILSLFVTGFGISSFVTPVGATAQIPIVSPSNTVINNGKGKVMILTEIIRAAKRLLGFVPQLDIPSQRPLLSACLNSPSKHFKLTYATST
jgi:hypothetical protein